MNTRPDPGSSAADDLRQSEALGDAVIDTIAALVVVLDRAGRIVLFNRACETATGFHSGEVVGRSVWETIIPPEDRAGVEVVFVDLVAGQFPNSHENAWLDARRDPEDHRVVEHRLGRRRR